MAMAQKLIELVRSIGADVKALTQRVDDAGALPVGSAGQVLKHNGSTWVAGADNDTTYAVMPEAEMQTGASAGARTLSAVLLKAAIVYHGLKLGSTAGTAKEGDWKPTWSDVENKPAVIAAGADQAAARAAIGAGTSSLVLGMTASTAAAGNHTHEGLMSQAERDKLAGVEVGANAFSLPPGSAGQVLKHNGTDWVAGSDNNTTYSAMSASEATTGTATSNRVITAAVLKGAIQTHAPAPTSEVIIAGLPAGTNGQVLKHNGSTWVAGADNNTTYTLISDAEAIAGTGIATRTVTPARLKLAIETHALKASEGQALEQRVSQLEASSSSGGITRARAQAIALCF